MSYQGDVLREALNTQQYGSKGTKRLAESAFTMRKPYKKSSCNEGMSSEGVDVPWIVDFKIPDEPEKLIPDSRGMVKCPYCTNPTSEKQISTFGMCWDCYDDGVE